MTFSPPHLSPPLTRDDRRAALAAYRQIIATSLALLLNRNEKDSAYGWLDTKIDLRTGREPADDDPIRGRGVVYGWIQGRGLEALARHAAWLSRQPQMPRAGELSERTCVLLRRLVSHIQAVCEAQGGRLAFCMDRAGRPLKITAGRVEPDEAPAQPAATLTDLFHAKGLAEAAALLQDQAALGRAVALFERVWGDIEAGTFRFDQQALDPRNPVRPVPGRHTHAPRMLSIMGATRLFVLTGERRFAEIACRCVAHLLRHHVAPADAPPLRQADFWEFIDDAGEPWRDADGALWSDPGHAIEAAGFALQHLRVCGRSLGGDHSGRAAQWTQVLLQNFRNGLAPSGIGIVKSFDLARRRPINADMPWWSLPETLRAAAEALAAGPDEHTASRLRATFAAASNALVSRYVRPDVGLMAVQCLTETGAIADAIPATPDADPGYHTNLCLIDVVDLLEDAGASR